MKKMLLGLVFVSLGWASGALGDQYSLDSSHTRIGFKVRHLAFSNVRGQFRKFSGSGEYDAKTGKISSLSVSIEAASIDTNEPDRDKHLRSDDFFAADKHKMIKFVSSKIKYKGKRPVKIIGKFTLRGVTKKIELSVDEWGGTATDAWGNERIAFEASGKIDRRDYGVKWNKGLKKIGGLTVGNEVKFELEIQAIKKEKEEKKK